MSPFIDRLTVIGLGLIGGSVALALRQAGAVGEIVGCGRGQANLNKGLELGVIDRAETDVAKAVAGADMVLVAVPLGAMRGVFAAMSGHLEPQAVITDAGSAKGSVVADFQAVNPEAFSRFVPGHPIAGTEHNGVEAAFPTLYQDRRVILTPTEVTEPEAEQKVVSLWEACGASVTSMSIEHHDSVLAATSHLPHMLAFGLVDALARMQDKAEIFQFAAGGFRDFTRIASSNPVMWRDICLANRKSLSEMLAAFASEMGDLARTIERGDGDHLLEIFERAKSARDSYVDGIKP